MVTRRFLGAAVLAAALVGASGVAHAAAERSLMGVVLGRSYRQVLAKFGTPNQVQAVVIPVPGQGTAGLPDQNNPGGAPGGPPGYGGPGGPPGYGGPPGGSGGPPGYGGPGGSGGGMSGGPAGGSGGPSYGAPGGSGGPPGYGGAGGSGGGPPALPPVGGAPGYGGEGAGGPGGAPITDLGNGAEWIYTRPGGVTMAFIINEDWRVAQISVSSPKAYPPAHTAKGIGLGADYKRVLMAYGYPPFQRVGGYFVEAYYTKNYHASFTFVKGKMVRVTIALAD